MLVHPLARIFQSLLFFVSLSLTTMIVSVTAAGAELKIGDVAPDFALPSAAGDTIKLSQFRGKTVVLEWFNKDCPYVHKFYDAKWMQRWQREAVNKGIVWLTVTSSAEGKEGYLTVREAAGVVKEKGLASTAFLLDSQGQVGRRYSAKTTPHVFIIDKSGKIVYQGAMDDRPSAQPKTLAGAQNYLMEALQALEKGVPVRTSSTTPYGCSVKY